MIGADVQKCWCCRRCARCRTIRPNISSKTGCCSRGLSAGAARTRPGRQHDLARPRSWRAPARRSGCSRGSTRCCGPEAGLHCPPDFGLAHLEPRPHGIHATGEILFAQQPAAEHDVGQRQQLLLGRRGPAVRGLAESILGAAPFQHRESRAGGKTLARRVKADFPGRIWVADVIARCELFPGLILVSYDLDNAIGARSAWRASATASG